MRTVAYCGDHTALTSTQWGAKIYVDTRDTSIAPHIMMDGVWEPWVSNAVAQVMQANKRATFIDVGANVGWYTLLACRFEAAHVFAFEPQARMCELLKKTISVNGLQNQVTLTQAACGSEFGVTRIIADPEEAGGGHLGERVPIHMLDIVCEGECALVRLDQSIAAATAIAAEPLIIKIDVEGYEPEVLRGAPGLLAMDPILFIEHHREEKNRTMLAELHATGFQLRLAARSGHWGPPLTVEEASALDEAETIIVAREGRLP